jgi:hypothetical protein
MKMAKIEIFKLYLKEGIIMQRSTLNRLYRNQYLLGPILAKIRISTQVKVTDMVT